MHKIGQIVEIYYEIVDENDRAHTNRENIQAIWKTNSALCRDVLQ